MKKDVSRNTIFQIFYFSAKYVCMYVFYFEIGYKWITLCYCLWLVFSFFNYLLIELFKLLLSFYIILISRIGFRTWADENFQKTSHDLFFIIGFITNITFEVVQYRLLMRGFSDLNSLLLNFILIFEI